MSYEIRTPVVLESVEAARAAISGIRDGSLEPRHAAIVVSGARALQAAVVTDIRARLADPKIRAQEAKLVEAVGRRGEASGGSTSSLLGTARNAISAD
ncbi:MAG TPA: hypothetical protein VFA12_20640 [Stellaceae bacterium]|nr:hypothetical protein [Stellaceae bacterium]